MEKDRFEFLTMEFLKGDINKEDKVLFEVFLNKNPEYKREFNALEISWSVMDNIKIPEPTEEMDKNFFQLLNSEIDKIEHSNWLDKLRASISLAIKPQLAYGMLVLAIGLTVGYFLNSNTQETLTTVVANDETEEIREQLVLTLLEQPSANKRLQAVNEASKLNVANEKVIKALFITLNNDPNINVRLVAIESLSKYSNTPEVRMGLVESIAFQDSPLVQIALADLMVELQEKTSVDSIKELLQQPDIDKTVKEKLEKSIKDII